MNWCYHIACQLAANNIRFCIRIGCCDSIQEAKLPTLSGGLLSLFISVVVINTLQHDKWILEKRFLVQFISCPPTRKAQPSFFSNLNFLYRTKQKSRTFLSCWPSVKISNNYQRAKKADLKKAKQSMSSHRYLNI